MACMTCPLCNKLFRDATTISECLHTCESLSNLCFLIFLLLDFLLSVKFGRFLYVVGAFLSFDYMGCTYFVVCCLGLACFACY